MQLPASRASSEYSLVDGDMVSDKSSVYEDEFVLLALSRARSCSSLPLSSRVSDAGSEASNVSTGTSVNAILAGTFPMPEGAPPPSWPHAPPSPEPTAHAAIQCDAPCNSLETLRDAGSSHDAMLVPNRSSTHAAASTPVRIEGVEKTPSAFGSPAISKDTACSTREDFWDRRTAACSPVHADVVHASDMESAATRLAAAVAAAVEGRCGLGPDPACVIPHEAPPPPIQENGLGVSSTAAAAPPDLMVLGCVQGAAVGQPLPGNVSTVLPGPLTGTACADVVAAAPTCATMDTPADTASLAPPLMDPWDAAGYEDLGSVALSSARIQELEEERDTLAMKLLEAESRALQLSTRLHSLEVSHRDQAAWLQQALTQTLHLPSDPSPPSTEPTTPAAPDLAAAADPHCPMGRTDGPTGVPGSALLGGESPALQGPAPRGLDSSSGLQQLLPCCLALVMVLLQHLQSGAVSAAACARQWAAAPTSRAAAAAAVD